MKNILRNLINASDIDMEKYYKQQREIAVDTEYINDSPHDARVRIRHDGRESNEWLGKRLAFLWDCMDTEQSLYCRQNLGYEKSEIYNINHGDSEKIYKIARKIYYDE